jgi:hypothetical protein
MDVGFEVLIEVVMKSSVLWDIMLCNLAKVTLWLCFACSLLHAGFLLGLLFSPETGADNFLRDAFRLSLGIVAPQKTELFQP